VSDYGGQPTRTYSNKYLYQNNSAYTAYYIYDRLWTSTLTSASPNVALASNTYDGSAPSSTSTLPHEWDPFNYPTTFTSRGNVTQANTPGTTINTTYDYTGTITWENDNGHPVAVTTSSATNYTLPSALIPNSTTNLQTLAAYGPSFAPTSVASPGQTLNNGTSGTAAFTSYDSSGRAASTQGPSQSATGTPGAQTTYAYGYNSTTGWTITATTPNSGGGSHFTTTILDGLGRTAGVKTGTGSTVLSEVDTGYQPCACSPLGKMYQQSLPYGPQDTEVYTIYAYDALGRTVNVLLADGASHTMYTYQGNFTPL
jgi:hypothetical protein